MNLQIQYVHNGRDGIFLRREKLARFHTSNLAAHLPLSPLDFLRSQCFYRTVLALT